MATTYKFTVQMPVTDTLPRNRISNTVHMQHTLGSLLDTDLEAICDDLVGMYNTRYNNAGKEIVCKAYDVDAKPNYPRAVSTINAGLPWVANHPREVALCLSFAGSNRGNRSERGRIYLMPSLAIAGAGAVDTVRPSTQAQNWALDFYDVANESFPDIGGVDWQFGIYSPTYNKFTTAAQAWVNDEWDTQRRRGLRETTRVTAVRQG